MRKPEARIYYRQKRAALSEAERMKMDDLLLIRFQEIPLPDLQFLLSYWPIDGNHEPNTHLFTDYLEFRNPGLVVCYPQAVFSPPGLTIFQTDDDTRFRKNHLNIYEPEGGEIMDPRDIDLVFVPLLAFDKKGFRVGYGKGMYDRFLQQCRPDCIKMGFSYFEPLEEIHDPHDFDIPLSFCVTPEAIYAF